MPGWPLRIVNPSAASAPAAQPDTPHAVSPAKPPRLTSDVQHNPAGDEHTAALPPPLRTCHSVRASVSATSPASRPRESPTRARGHSRSLSDRLPALFGSARRRPDADADLEPASAPADSRYHDRAHGMAPQKAAAARAANSDDQDVEVGRCATCDQKAKWPKGRSEYRCSTCLMVNDLHRPGPHKMPTAPGSATVTAADGRPPTRAPGNEFLQLTLAHTAALIDQCMLAFLEVRFHTSKANRRLYRQNSAEDGTAYNFSRPLGYPVERSSSRGHMASASPRPPTATHERRRLSPRRDGPASPERTSSLAEPQKTSLSPSYRSRALDVTRQKPQSGTTPVTIPVRPSRSPPRPPQTDSPIASGASPSAPQLNPFLTTAFTFPNRSGPLSPTGASDIDSPAQAPELPDKDIFRPLEEYLSQRFGNFRCLNNSFVKQYRRPHGGDRSAEQGKARSAQARTEAENFTDSSLTNIDPKMLLLGDIAENGLWWTGRPDERRQKGRGESALDRTPSLTNHRTPNIAWGDVSKWYSMVIGLGRDWRLRLNHLSSDKPDDWAGAISDEEAAACEATLSAARAHLHRVMLRSSDTLLKRPGQALKEAGDLRFLLIFLANPLLNTRQSPSTSPRRVELARQASAPDSHFTKETNMPRSMSVDKWEASHVHAILKRILGLLSNSPADCQKCLTSWFSRYNQGHFRSMVELIGSFVSHRLQRSKTHRHTRSQNLTSGLVPNLSGTGTESSAELHAALSLGGRSKAAKDDSDEYPAYCDDWQIRAAARVMALLFTANKSFHGPRSSPGFSAMASTELTRNHIKTHGQALSTSDFYNMMVDFCDVVADFDIWEKSPSKFTFCQYPFLLSLRSKYQIMEHDARRQMEVKAREAFFKSLLRNAMVDQHIILRVRRDCLVEDSLKNISEVVAQGPEEMKKGLKVQFVDEEGVDAGGLRKEWFLLLVREIFDPHHAMFVYDEDSRYCYFNPHSFETSDQYFLVGALLGLAIYNSTILDVPLPPFTFRKLLLSSGSPSSKQGSFVRGRLHHTLDDLAEWRPQLARGLQSLLDFQGNVQETFCRDFVVEVERYGQKEQVELCPGGSSRAVTNQNRDEFVDLYIRYLLDTQVTRQFEPFKRGFFTVCGGNALSLFQPEEIELVVRGSEERVDVPSIRAVAVYDNWHSLDPSYKRPEEQANVVRWFWEAFEDATPDMQRKLLGFVTGSDRIPAVGAASLIIKIGYGGEDWQRLPVARTCFNRVLLHAYRTRQELEEKLWMAVTGSQGFGLA